MHELAVTQSMLDLVLKQAEGAGATAVKKINLVIGEMCGVVGDCVQFYFDFLSKGTPAEGAELCFKMVPTTGTCRSCGKSFPVEEFNWACPHCGHQGMDVTGGRELLVESIEVD